jgi:hypothetical protein
MPQSTANVAPGAAYDATPSPRRACPVLLATDGSAPAGTAQPTAQREHPVHP